MDIKPLILSIGASVVLLGGAVWWAGTQSPPQSNGELVSANGLHWHPQLTIFVKGEQQEIPQSIGLAGGHKPMHTHEDLPIIHLEFQGAVRSQDITLKKFFDTWGKDMPSFGTNMTMTVNGEPNAELGDYIFRDGDKVELRYE